MASNIIPSFSGRRYVPKHTSWPYTPTDFNRMDDTPDPTFYHIPRFVTHIDDHAIFKLKQYYTTVLPKSGRVLDFCSSWISHFPKEHAELAKSKGGSLSVIGMGMNRSELEANEILNERIIQDLNVDPSFPPKIGQLDAAVCVVSIDYLTQPLPILTSLKQYLKPGKSVHLIISNRCFPTKVIKRWMDISEEERLEMVADYLYFAGYEEIEIVTLSDGTAGVDQEGYLTEDGSGRKVGVDPLWVVRGMVPATQE